MNSHVSTRSSTLDWWQVVAVALLVLGLGSLGLAIGGAQRADAADLPPTSAGGPPPAENDLCSGGAGKWSKFTLGGGSPAIEVGSPATNYELSFEEGTQSVRILGLVDTNGDPLQFEDVFIKVASTQYFFDYGPALDTGADFLATGAGNGNANELFLCAIAIVPDPALTVTKTIVDADTIYLPGETITYSIVVGNTGNIDLTAVTVDDPNATLGSCAPVALPGTLLVGQSTTCPATYVVPASGLTSSLHTNTATATSDQVDSDPSSVDASLLVPLTITKDMTGPVVDGDPTSFDIAVSCNGSSIPVNPFIDGESDVLLVPAGSACTVTELAPLGYEVTLTGAITTNGGSTTMSEARSVTVTNARDFADVLIRKDTVAPIGVAGSFVFDIDCLDDTYDADGVVTLDTLGTDSETSSPISLPVGLGCTITENVPTGWELVTDPAAGEIVVAADGQTVVFENERLLGQIVISKTAQAPDGEAGSFTFLVTCTNGFGTSVTLTTVGAETVSSAALPAAGLPTGTQCTVTENLSPGWTRLSPPGPATVTIVEGVNPVAFTNARNLGGLVVTKTITGTTALGPVDGTFTMALDCTGIAYDVPSFAITTVNGTGSQPFQVGSGVTCTVTETVPAGWSQVSITDSDGPADGTVTIGIGGPDDPPESVTVTNQRNTTSLTITKGIDRSTGTHIFSFDVTCDLGSGPQTLLSSPFTITLVNGVLTGSVVVPGIPTGADCVVTEQDHPLFDQIIPAIGAGVVLDNVGAGAIAPFENDRSTAPLTIQKVALGGNATFSFTVHCSDGSDYGPVSVTTANGAGSVVLPVEPPTGVTCNVSETAQLGWGQVDPVLNQTIPVVISDTLPNAATFTNGILAIDTEKTVVSAGPFDLGDLIEFEITVTNTGQAKLFDVVVTDDTPGVVLGECVVTGAPLLPTESAVIDEFPWRLPLYPGQVITCSATHVVTQADLDSATCSFSNAATGVGYDDDDPFEPEPADSVSDRDTVVAALECQPSLNLTKTVTSAGPYTLGSNITYALVVENTGNVTLHGVSITEAPGVTLGACTPAAPATLAPGQTMTCNANHVATLANTNAGTFVNTATADSTETGPDSASATVTFLRDPELTVTKTVATTPPPPAGGYVLGSTITYDIVATNTGNITLTTVEITDPGVGVTLGACNPTQPSALDPGQSMTCRATHVVTQLDLNAARYTNTAFADSDQTDPVSDAEIVTLPWNPSLTIDKVARALPATPVVGTVVTFDIVVTNNGNVTLTGVTANEVTVDATLVGCSVSLPTTLAPGQTFSCTATHALTQADLNAGSYSNTAAASSDQFGQVRDTATVSTPNPAVDLAIVKTATSPFVVGQQATYTLAVRNNGPGAEPSPVVTDNLPSGLTFVSASGDGWTCTSVGSSVSCRSTSAVAANGVLPVITLTVLVGAEAVPSVTNTGLVSGVRPDAVPSNNASSATAPVTQVLAQTATPPAATAPATSFAHTGAATAALLLTGVGMVLAGLAMLIARRRIGRPAR